MSRRERAADGRPEMDEPQEQEHPQNAAEAVSASGADAAGRPAATPGSGAVAPADAGPLNPEAAGPATPPAPPAPPAAPARTGAGAAPAAVAQRPAEQYLIAKRAGPLPADLQPLDVRVLQSAFDRTGIKVLRTLAPPGPLGLLSDGLPGAQPTIFVAQASPDVLRSFSADPRLIVEPDHELYPVATAAPPGPVLRDPGVLVPQDTVLTVTIMVTGKGAPIAGTNVYVYGSTWPAQGITADNGQVTVQLFGETVNSIQGLYVKPKADFWSFWLPRPSLNPNQPNLVELVAFDQTFPGFPNQQVNGWGEKAMRMDQLPPNYRGRGVRIGVIDSGAAVGHPDLRNLFKGGFDTTANSAQGWQQDTVFHGTHCAGVIAGLDNQVGIRGFAPEADLYSYKIFPGGRFSNLIDALNRCIEDQIDVANLSLGTDETSELLDQKLQEAKQKGIACIVAAGNSGAAVQFPARSPHVLAVSAIGKTGEFPASSYHGTTAMDGTASPDGYFSARFSCFGPEVGVCGPGVAILSCVPDTGYAAWDGTSMATPHVTGLAALLLAHHPEFLAGTGPKGARNADRVNRLFEILKQSARPLALGDPGRTGAGLPDAIGAFSIGQVQAPATGAGAGAAGDVQSAMSQLQQTLAAIAAALQRLSGTAAGPTQPQVATASVGPGMPSGTRPTSTTGSTGAAAPGLPPPDQRLTPAASGDPDLQELNEAVNQARRRPDGVAAASTGPASAPGDPDLQALNAAVDRVRQRMGGLSTASAGPGGPGPDADLQALNDTVNRVRRVPSGGGVSPPVNGSLSPASTGAPQAAGTGGWVDELNRIETLLTQRKAS